MTVTHGPVARFVAAGGRVGTRLASKPLHTEAAGGAHSPLRAEP